MISQITADGFKPASLDISTAASVCPALTSTPPSFALRGNTWPGVARSLGPDNGFIAVEIVNALSCAEIPVVTPSLA